MVRLPSKDEDMLVHAFKKGVLAGPFSESLIRNCPSTFAEIRRRAVAHIAAETAVSEKRERDPYQVTRRTEQDSAADEGA